MIVISCRGFYTPETEWPPRLVKVLKMFIKNSLPLLVRTHMGLRFGLEYFGSSNMDRNAQATECPLIVYRAHMWKFREYIYNR